jgi:hypothetical protein
LPAIYELEHDADVIEYFDQAPSIKLDYLSADGKRLGALHSPDFFVIRQTKCGLGRMQGRRRTSQARRT